MPENQGEEIGVVEAGIKGRKRGGRVVCDCRSMSTNSTNRCQVSGRIDRAPRSSLLLPGHRHVTCQRFLDVPRIPGVVQTVKPVAIGEQLGRSDASASSGPSGIRGPSGSAGSVRAGPSEAFPGCSRVTQRIAFDRQLALIRDERHRGTPDRSQVAEALDAPQPRCRRLRASRRETAWRPPVPL